MKSLSSGEQCKVTRDVLDFKRKNIRIPNPRNGSMYGLSANPFLIAPGDVLFLLVQIFLQHRLICYKSDLGSGVSLHTRLVAILGGTKFYE